MAVTRATIERELLEELGPYLKVCKLDSTTQDGNNVALEGPIRQAVESCGGEIADWPSVTDADIATVTTAPSRIVYFGKFFAFDKCWGNWPHTDQTHGSESQRLDQLAKRLRERLAEYKEELKDPTNIPGVTVLEPDAPEAGTIKAGTYGYLSPPNPFGRRLF